MVTLSCLIVIAALFSQVSSNTPASAIPKVLDYFFFYIIFRLFYIVCHHTFLQIIIHWTETKTSKHPAGSNSKQAWSNETKSEQLFKRRLIIFEVFACCFGIMMDILSGVLFVIIVIEDRMQTINSFEENPVDLE